MGLGKSDQFHETASVQQWSGHSTYDPGTFLSGFWKGGRPHPTDLRQGLAKHQPVSKYPPYFSNSICVSARIGGDWISYPTFRAIKIIAHIELCKPFSAPGVSYFNAQINLSPQE
jgi:hypothetical protein